MVEETRCPERLRASEAAKAFAEKRQTHLHKGHDKLFAMHSFGDRLRWAMQQTDPPTSMRGLARRVGIHYQAIQYLCDPGRNAKGSRHTHELARALGVSPRWLASGKGKPFRPDSRSTVLEALQTASVLVEQLQRLAAELDENGKNGKNGKKA